MWKIKEIKQSGKAAFQQNYWLGVLAIVVCMMAATGIGATMAATSAFEGLETKFNELLELYPYGYYGLSVGALISIVVGIVILALVVTAVAITEAVCVTLPVEVGVIKYYLESNKGNADSSNLMFAFKKGKFGNVVKSIFLYELFTFLWSLLFIVPGIIKAYQWRLVPYIMAENPEINAKDARMLSKKLMYGNKWHAFGFDLSFIWWHILSALTLGVLYIFWTAPFIEHSSAALYQKLVALDEEKKAEEERKALEKAEEEAKAAKEAAKEAAKAKKTTAKKAPEKKAPAKKSSAKKTDK